MRISVEDVIRGCNQGRTPGNSSTCGPGKKLAGSSAMENVTEKEVIAERPEHVYQVQQEKGPGGLEGEQFWGKVSAEADCNELS